MPGGDSWFFQELFLQCIVHEIGIGLEHANYLNKQSPKAKKNRLRCSVRRFISGLQSLTPIGCMDVIYYAPTNRRKVQLHVQIMVKPLRQQDIGFVLELSGSTRKPPYHPRYKFGCTKRGGKIKPPVTLKGGGEHTQKEHIHLLV